MIAIAAAGLGAAVAGPAAAAARAGGVFDYDADKPLEATASKAQVTDAARVQKITFKAADGTTVPALLSVPKNARGRVPCILSGHPLTGTKEEVFGEFSDTYAARGVALMAIDARYHGERKGIGPLKAAAKLDTMYKLFQLTVIDMRRALDYLDSRGICDPARVGYEGRSLGGFMGSMLIGADPRIKAAVLYVSGADWRTYLARSWVWLGGNLTGAKLDAAVRRLGPIDPKIWIARAAGRPVFMANGRRDDATPLAAAKALHAAAGKPKEVVIYDGGHDTEEPHHARVYKASAMFFKKYLGIPAG
jgi:dipeptidyl aminopeptidase/acylaminoacyl peptidase